MAETLVLIHGGWHGAWCWAAVANQLDKHGDHTFAPDLPGSVANPCDRSKVTLATYVDCVVRFIEERGLKNLVLVGHDMAGLVLPGVAIKIPGRIKRTVFVTANVAEDGRPCYEPDHPYLKPLLELANSRYDKSLPVESVAERFRQFFMPDASRELQEYVLSCLCPQPLRPLIEPVNMRDFYATGIPQSYLVCENDTAPAGAAFAHELFMSRLRNPSTRTLASAHEPMFTKPVECAEALYEFARE